jgi:hypothetical protein
MHKADLGSQFADTIKLGFSAPSLRSERQQKTRRNQPGRELGLKIRAPLGCFPASGFTHCHLQF